MNDEHPHPVPDGAEPSPSQQDDDIAALDVPAEDDLWGAKPVQGGKRRFSPRRTMKRTTRYNPPSIN